MCRAPSATACRTRAAIPRPIVASRLNADLCPPEIEVSAVHGWCLPDSGVHNEPQPETVWSRVLGRYDNALPERSSAIRIVSRAPRSYVRA
jgi:hypothetical protein